MSSERQEYNENTPWWGEHIHRYKEAIKYLKTDYVVLDIACGSGFGSYLLSKELPDGNVTGADISPDAISFSANHFSNTNLRYILADGTKLPFQSGNFNAIISFETIEHTTAYNEMLIEFYRVLKPGGVLIISTPNILVNSPGGIVKNPFHTQEFSYKELNELLKKIFSDVEFFGQKYNRYNNKTLKNVVGKVVEKILYNRGIRKLPIHIQDSIMKILIGKKMYPEAGDYLMVAEKEELLKCKTFFAVCRKK